MTDINRGSCFWCGEKVGEKDWDYVGQNRVWVCGQAKCVRALQNEQRGEYEDRYLRAYDDEFSRY